MTHLLTSLVEHDYYPSEVSPLYQEHDLELKVCPGASSKGLRGRKKYSIPARLCQDRPSPASTIPAISLNSGSVHRPSRLTISTFITGSCHGRRIFSICQNVGRSGRTELIAWKGRWMLMMGRTVSTSLYRMQDTRLCMAMPRTIVSLSCRLSMQTID